MVLWWCYSGSSGDSGGIGSTIKVKSGTVMSNTVQSSCSRQCGTVQYTVYSIVQHPYLPSPPLPFPTLSPSGVYSYLPTASLGPGEPWRALKEDEGGWTTVLFRAGHTADHRPPTPDPRRPVRHTVQVHRRTSIHPYIHTYTQYYRIHHHTYTHSTAKSSALLELAS